jgi:CheY-like chemotaxis protein
MKGDKPFRVLIVEDEVLLAAELEYLVAASGAAPIGHAMTSGEAVDLAERLHPDLALVDVHLSDGPTGIDAARRMTEHCGAIVLFITANMKRLPEDFAGACGVMSKPYSEHQVRMAITFLAECAATGHSQRPPPHGLVLAPEFAKRWGVVTAA